MARQMTKEKRLAGRRERKRRRTEERLTHRGRIVSGFVRVITSAYELERVLQPWQVALKAMAQSVKKLVPLWRVRPV